MKKIYFLLLLIPSSCFALQELVDDKVDTAAEVSVINGNDKELDSKKLDKNMSFFRFPARSAIDNTIVSQDVGNAFYNTSTPGEVCVSTQAGVSTAWVKMNTTTPCSN